MFHVETFTPAASDPLTAAEVRAFLRLNHTAEDTLLTELIQATAERFEQDARRPVIATTYRQYFTCWVTPIVLMRGGVTSVTGVTRYKPDLTTEAVTDITSDLKTPPARVFLSALPDTAYTTLGVKVAPTGYVDFVAGWANAAAVPKTVRSALKLLLAHFYTNRSAYRDSELTELPMGWQAVVNQYRTGLVGPWGQ